MKIEEFKKLKVGDKVQIVKDYDRSFMGCIRDGWNVDGKMDKWLGKVMTIRKLESGSFGGAYVRMEEDKNEHMGYGWMWSSNMIENKVEAHKETIIVIKTDGKTVTAYRGKEKGVAKCSPEDEFDLYTGASLAIDRLFGEDKKHHSYSFPMKGTLNVEFDDDKMSGSIKFDAPAAEASMEEKKIDIPAEKLMKRKETKPCVFVELTDDCEITPVKHMTREEADTLKPGDKVQIVSTKPIYEYTWCSEQDKYLGKVVTIKERCKIHDELYFIEEDQDEHIGLFGKGHLWDYEHFEKKVEDVPKEKTKPEVKEVKREAKKGDWIKIVKPSFTEECYSKGDILKVYKRSRKHNGVYCETKKKVNKYSGINNDKGNVIIVDTEYVVLEGYEPTKEETKPEVKEVKRPAKVGEWVKIIYPIIIDGLYEKGDILKCCHEYPEDRYTGIDVDLISYPGKTFHVYHDEYVVLENYQPEEK